MVMDYVIAVEFGLDYGVGTRRCHRDELWTGLVMDYLSLFFDRVLDVCCICAN